ncbi:hypothetical protein UF78_05825 [Stutzerimonas stutzeri]|uniref:Uncharacterized protein n=1 Tax=Stutzerimonas stutzeri TaxID=316 RepID=A0A0D9AR99_STUST|nr:hypothetical protein UF78_05825 [Stutzerimonas stutzeri]
MDEFRMLHRNSFTSGCPDNESRQGKRYEPLLLMKHLAAGGVEQFPATAERELGYGARVDTVVPFAGCPFYFGQRLGAAAAFGRGCVKTRSPF